MKLLYLAPLMLALVASCATPGDLRDLADSFEDFQSGAITDTELEDAIAAKADEIEERTVDLVESMPTSPAGWLALLAQLGATAAIGGYGVNRYRDKKRVLRGEATGSTPPPLI
tara:strand:+ start:22933 stop:23274 length:342 start_codon:yes stop_codon:yes gene_type:complete